jgi:predicted PurR-regulated permease PerM
MREMSMGYVIIVMASVIVVLAGVKSASEILVPVLLSLFLAIILSPFYNFFRNKKLPDAIALILVVLFFILFIFLVLSLIGSSVQEFRSNINFYTKQLNQYQIQLLEFASNYGIDIPKEEFFSMLDTKNIMNFASMIVNSLSSVFTNGFVIVLTVIFMLLEGSNFTEKLSLADTKRNSIRHIEQIFSRVKEYMVLKAIISLITGLIIWVALLLIGTDYPFLWAFLAFLLNFIPNIGSIIAAVPAVLLTLVQLGSFSAMMVMLLYTAINVIIGSVIEPKVMGKGLGLSTLVVFLSLLFWGWLLGPVGMLLSVPLTIMAKIIFDSNKSTQWIAILLGDTSGANSKT